METDQVIEFSATAKRVIERAVSLAARFDQAYVSTEHLLFALIDVDNLKINKLLMDNGVNGKKMVEQLFLVLDSAVNFERMSQTVEQLGKMLSDVDAPEDEIFKQMDKVMDFAGLLPEDAEQEQAKNKEVMVKERKYARKKTKKTLLNFLARNLTDEKEQKNIDPVIGRDDEIKRVVQILSRRTKNNPVLLGEPGVGKTAIIEGLAKKISQGDVADILLNKKIYALDLSMLVAGASMRGEFEARLKQVIEEVKNDPDIILFIDELHNVVGAGSLPGAMDAANILKPALARGELRCIGATTFNEYKKYIEEDAALDRRFQPVQVLEPSIEEAVQILQGVKSNYEKHHLVKISDEAISSAVELSVQYLPEKFLPDKAIDLIDEAAAKLRVEANVVDEDLRQLKLIEKKIIEIEEQKFEYVKKEDYPTALKLKEKEIVWQDKYMASQEKILQTPKVDKWLGQIKVKDIAEVVSQATGLPLENLVNLENQLVNVEKRLSQKIVGQNEVLKQLVFYLKRAKAGLAGKQRPLGSFMFLGPSGVGKTETAKVLAQEIFSRKNKSAGLVRFDMSEFTDKFNLSRLIGAPAGYIGYKEGGRLTEAVRRNPYCVVLFDEIEKAHPEVFNILLQILDEGELTDASGKRVNFRNTVIILTSNLGSEKFEMRNIGFEWQNNGIPSSQLNPKSPIGTRDDLISQTKEIFKPEFLNRLDKILVFKSLSLKSMEKIVEMELNRLVHNLANKNIKLVWNEKFVQALGHEAFSFETGARNVRRVVEQRVENKLADKILSRQIKPGVDVKLNELKNET
ncbi:ATP-dependent Clp protease ATP-binding subunit [Candidatus Parcubacteria bacterium]|nr:ATP-dependent Clp protease ATP-binding subunit [Candidatus Parcubacteria bacterium]